MIPGLQKTVNISTISITGNCNTKQMHITSSFMKYNYELLLICNKINFTCHNCTKCTNSINYTNYKTNFANCIVCSNCTWIIKKSHTICQITSRRNPSLTVLNPSTPKITFISNSTYCLPYSSSDVGLENLLLDLLTIP